MIGAQRIKSLLKHLKDNFLGINHAGLIQNELTNIIAVVTYKR